MINLIGFAILTVIILMQWFALKLKKKWGNGERDAFLFVTIIETVFLVVFGIHGDFSQ